MSFNSVVFILGFLPLSVLGYYLLSIGPLHRLRLPFLAAMSLFFYGRAQVHYIPLLLGSVLFNYAIALCLVRFEQQPRRKQTVLALGVTIDAALLLGFKYLSPALGAIFASHNPIPNLVAPLAISFYTFQQISFLVDVSRGRTQVRSFMSYLSFILFFPTLLAGPITLYTEMGSQLSERPRTNRIAQNVLIGLVLFSLGLFKKTFLADTLTLWVDPLYTSAHQGHTPGFFPAWASAFGYTLQIYFDFSGYSDMAIGAARMLGIVLPLNFFSPLRSTSIAELWRRWHMTLGRFVRVYLFQPISLPLARFAAGRGYSKWTAMTFSTFVPTFFSMLILGAWHGPSWTFVLFGAMQGTFMVINELYAALTRKARRKKKDTPRALAIFNILTVLSFASAAVPFRSETVADSMRIFAGMLGMHGLGITQDWKMFFAPSGNGMLILMLLAGFLIVYLLPNTEQWMTAIYPALDWDNWRNVSPAPIRFTFRFTPVAIALASLAFFLGFAFISRGTTNFIYFKF